MSDIPRITGAEAVRAFERADFVVVRTKGSHQIMKKAGHKNRLSIPVHSGKNIGLGLLKSQIDAAGLTVEEFKALL
jgi:predicted RNA binding protein YcfA (HicA-like mRNA interferase family)